MPPGPNRLAAMSPVVQRLSVHGRVQGVSFRASMAREARRLGVLGWVRNRPDGTVEAVVAGAPEAVHGLVNWARRGPSAARVTRLDIRVEAGDESFTSFEQRPTG
jgi:acylphosphatase